MTGGIEAIGSMVDGGLLARAVEPAAGETGAHAHSGACLNCGTVLTGPHCHACGQAAHVHRTLGAFFHDFLHGVLHFDGKIWRTLPLLAWRPGQLTREYIEGRRASYVSPIALFLFATFLMFAVFHAVGSPARVGTFTVNGKKQTFAQAEQTLGSEIVQLQAKRNAAVAASQPTAAIDKQLADARSAVKLVRALHGDAKGIATVVPNRATSGNPWLDRVWRNAKANPDSLLYRLQENAYKYSWLLIVISVPFVWLLFAWRRRYTLYDHTVFVTYSLSFMMLALTVASIGTAFGLSVLVVLPVLYAPFHMYRQLRGAYAVSRSGGLVRTVLLLVFATVALSLWSAVLVGMLIG